MPTILQTAHGKVTGLWGHALIRGANGKMAALKLGDVVQRGDVILTTQDGIVQLTPEKDTAVAGNELDRVIAGLNADNPDAAPAAVLGGDGAGDLSPGLRVDRISESVSATVLPQSSSEAATTITGNTTTAQAQSSATSFTAESSTIGATEEGGSVNLGLGTPSGVPATAVVTVGHVPAIGHVEKSDGTVVTAGSTLTPAELAGLTYVPPADYDGSSPVGDFDYTISSGGVSASGSTSIALGTVNDAPLATAGTTSGLEDTTLPISLAGTDVDGSIAGVTITGMPTGSTLLLADGVTPVLPGQHLSASDAAGLLFKPAPDFNGGTHISFTVTDDAGAVSAPQSVAINVIAVNDAPVAFADAATTLEDTPISGNLLVNDSDTDGPALSISGFSVAGSSYSAGASAALPGVGSLMINADGSYTFTPAANYNGAVPTASYTVSDGTFTSSSTLALSVTSVNDAPTPLDDLASTAINTPLTIAVLANDSDVDGGALSVSNAVLAQPAQGTVSINPDGTLLFTPATNFSGNATISYTVTDASGASATASVSVNVGNNTPP
ncbi:MAG TPA: tandem-95 repeat protein, partial [Albitalea sp.]|nr:tandem-95 repeat protein [Albitalea sp.]